MIHCIREQIFFRTSCTLRRKTKEKLRKEKFPCDEEIKYLLPDVFKWEVRNAKRQKKNFLLPFFAIDEKKKSNTINPDKEKHTRLQKGKQCIRVLSRHVNLCREEH